MGGMSDKIEAFISTLLKNEENEWIELRRNELASMFDCVPSQINYVISTRFSPSHGYIVESRRGGGGYLRIKRIAAQLDDVFITVLNAIGDEIDYQTANTLLLRLFDMNILNKENSSIIRAAISDRSIPIMQPQKNIVRATILKNMLSVVFDENS